MGLPCGAASPSPADRAQAGRASADGISMSLPRVGSVVEVTLDGAAGGTVYRSRLEGGEGDRLWVTLPDDPRLAAVSGLACLARVRWSAGARGSASARARLTIQGGSPVTVLIELVGPVELEQNRRFVRGGGFEPVELCRELAGDPATYRGWVVDLSEASVCGRFPELQVAAGESVTLRMDIEGAPVGALGEVLKVNDGPIPGTTSVVVGYDLDEPDARKIRRYLLRQQARIRSRRHVW
jgi:hypothetical protein